MRKRYFQKIGAGVGALALASLGVLTPTVSMADPVSAPTGNPVTVAPEDVKVNMKIISNDTMWEKIDEGSSPSFAYARTVTYVVLPIECEDDGCVVHGLGNRTDFVRVESPNEYASGGAILPDVSEYSQEGIYAWVVREVWQGPGSSVGASPVFWPATLSGAEYEIRATVKKDGDGFAYDSVTITKVTNDDGTPNGSTVGRIDFVNVSENTGNLEVTQKVVNDEGFSERDSYDMKVVFEWPENFNGQVNAATGKWTITVPEVEASTDASVIGATEAENTNCVPNTSKKTTECIFTLAKDKTARFDGIPVGSRYTITQISTGGFTTTYEKQEGVIPTPIWTERKSVAIPPVPVPDLSGADKEEDCSLGSSYAQEMIAAHNFVYSDSWVESNPHFEWNAQDQKCEFKSDPIDHRRNTEIQIHAVVTSRYGDLVPVFRLYDPVSREHLYSTDEVEYGVLQSRGWKGEGIAWYAPRSSSEGVYRLFHPVLGDHHYTSNQTEIDVLTSQRGWVLEGDAKTGVPVVLFFSDDQQRVELWRLYRPGWAVGGHLHTSDPQEYEILQTRGWVGEGTSFYGAQLP